MSSILWLPEQIGDPRARVTAGLPSLDPLRRAHIGKNEMKREKLHRAEMDGRQKQAQALAPDGARSRTSLEQCLGKPLSGTEVRKRLARLNPSLIFEDHPTMPRICISVRDARVQPEKKRFICAMERGFAPEFSVLDPEKGNETARGYWTVIHRLMREGLITKGAAEKAFGTPYSKNYQALTT
jgi:hypothetical protein